LILAGRARILFTRRSFLRENACFIPFEARGFARGDIDSILLLQIAYPEVTVLGTATGFHPAVGALGKFGLELPNPRT